jgi:hypothetical protein
LAIAQFRWAGAKDAGVISEEMEYIEIALIQANQQATKTLSLPVQTVFTSIGSLL